MKKVKSEDLVNWWLEKFHNTNIEKVTKEHPDWDGSDSREFFKTYSVTEEQHDEWEAWAKEHVRKITKLPKKAIDRSFWSISLNTAPSVKE